MEGKNITADFNGKLLLILTVTLSAVLLPLMAFAQVHVGRVVEGTWLADYSPYYVDNTLIILSGTTLTIEPSVEVLFISNDSIRVYGTLDAVGNCFEGIYFDNISSSTEKWYGIIFDGIWASASQMQYCSLLNSTHGITINNAAPQITDSYIASDFTGIYSNAAAPVIQFNHINVAFNIDVHGIAYGIKLYESIGVIENNRIDVQNPNIQIDVNAFGIHSQSSESATYLKLNYNQIYTWSKGKPVGVFLYGSSKDTVRYNEIITSSSNFFVRAGLMQADCANGFITNNTFVVSSPYKDISLQFQQYTFGVKIIDNIIFGDFNSKGIEFLDSSVPEEILYNDLYGHSEILVGYSPLDPSNILDDPLFTNIYPDSLYYLTEHSPCINAGHPALFFYDPDGTIGDIGAHYYHIEVEVTPSSPPEHYDFVSIYPNPTNASAVIKLDLHNACDVQIEAYDILGRSVAEIFQGKLESNLNSFLWNMSNLSDGIYFVRIAAQNDVQVKKVILIK